MAVPVLDLLPLSEAAQSRQRTAILAGQRSVLPVIRLGPRTVGRTVHRRQRLPDSAPAAGSVAHGSHHVVQIRRLVVGESVDRLLRTVADVSSRGEGGVVVRALRAVVGVVSDGAAQMRLQPHAHRGPLAVLTQRVGRAQHSVRDEGMRDRLSVRLLHEHVDLVLRVGLQIGDAEEVVRQSHHSGEHLALELGDVLQVQREVAGVVDGHSGRLCASPHIPVADRDGVGVRVLERRSVVAALHGEQELVVTALQERTQSGDAHEGVIAVGVDECGVARRLQLEGEEELPVAVLLACAQSLRLDVVDRVAQVRRAQNRQHAHLHVRLVRGGDEELHRAVALLRARVHVVDYGETPPKPLQQLS